MLARIKRRIKRENKTGYFVLFPMLWIQVGNFLTNSSLHCRWFRWFSSFEGLAAILDLLETFFTLPQLSTVFLIQDGGLNNRWEYPLAPPKSARTAGYVSSGNRQIEVFDSVLVEKSNISMWYFPKGQNLLNLERPIYISPQIGVKIAMKRLRS